MRNNFCVIAICFFITACTSDPVKVYKPAPPSPLYPVKLHWANKLHELGHDKYARLLPAVTNERILVADIAGNVTAFNPQNGKKLWKKEYFTKFSAGPVIYGNQALLGTKNAEVIAISADTGEVIWKQQVSSEVLVPPQSATGTIVVQTNDGKVFGLAAKDGKKIWVYDRNVPILSLRGNSTPAVLKDKVIVGFASGKLVALSLADGKLIWEATITLPKGRTELERIVDIDGPVVAKDDVIYVAAYRGKVAAVEAISGRLLWTRELSSYLGVVVDGDLLFVTDDNGKVWALNRENGATFWVQEALQDRAITRPAIVGDKVVIGDVTGELYWLSKSDGQLLGHFEHDKVSKLSLATNYVDEIDREEYQDPPPVETAVIFQPLVVDNNLVLTYQNGILAFLSVDN